MRTIEIDADAAAPGDTGAAGTETTRIVRRGVRRRTLLLVAAAITGALVAVAGAWTALSGGAVDDRLLIVDEAGAISLVDPGSGATTYSVPDAFAVPDRSALLTTRPQGPSTVLESRDPTTGQVTGTTTLDGELSVRTVSPRGGAVALLPGPRPRELYLPEPRTSTAITVSFTDDRPAQSFDLAGNYEPEMFSLDETTLFLLEFTPPAEPDGYHVRQLDLATGEVSDTGAPAVELNEKMRGKARAQVLHPEGRFLYTLYTMPTEAGPVHDVEAPGDQERWAFVHVINLDEQWSHCIFLPLPIGTVDEASVGMGLAPDGRTLYVADASTSTVATIDAEDLTVTGSTHVEQLRESGEQPAVAVAGDGTLYLASGPIVVELAGDSLEPVAALTHPLTIAGLSVSATGDQLRIGTNEGISIVDRATREEVAVLTPPGGGTAALLGPPQGSVTQFPVECAC